VTGGHSHGHGHGRGDARGGNRADSAGVPWAGRTLTAQPFAGDDGTTDPALAAALAGGSLADVVRAWAPSRALVPVVAVLGEGEELVAVAGDKSADMALATLTGADGTRALPAFTSAAALATWDAAARPVPVEAARAAQAAVAEGCDVVVLDVAGPASRVLPRPAVWAVAQGRDWLPPAEDPEVVAAVAAACGDRPHLCTPDGDAGLTVTLGLPPGLEPAEAREAASGVGRRLAADELVTERVTAIRLALRQVT
jgi:hypothetical protein